MLAITVCTTKQWLEYWRELQVCATGKHLRVICNYVWRGTSWEAGSLTCSRLTWTCDTIIGKRRHSLMAQVLDISTSLSTCDTDMNRPFLVQTSMHWQDIHHKPYATDWLYSGLMKLTKKTFHQHSYLLIPATTLRLPILNQLQGSNTSLPPRDNSVAVDEFAAFWTEMCIQKVTGYRRILEPGKCCLYETIFFMQNRHNITLYSHACSFQQTHTIDSWFLSPEMNIIQQCISPYFPQVYYSSSSARTLTVHIRKTATRFWSTTPQGFRILHSKDRKGYDRQQAMSIYRHTDTRTRPYSIDAYLFSLSF